MNRQLPHTLIHWVLAAPVAIDDWRIAMIAVPLVLMTVAAASREERVWMASTLGDDYRAYRRRTGMFVPVLWRD